MANPVPFITGSRAYGRPKPQSDLDLCVALPAEVIKELRTISEAPFPKLVFGKLNLVVFNSDKEEEIERFFRWKEVNDKLIYESLSREVTREEAVKAFQEGGAHGNAGDY